MIGINAPQKPRWCGEVFLHPLTFSDPDFYLGSRLQAVLQVLARRIVGEECKPRELRLPQADPLIQRVEELFHCGGAVETHHLHGNEKETFSFDARRKHEPAEVALY